MDDSLISDSNYDSGAFSRNSTPEPDMLTLRRQNILMSEVAPLLSPPLVMSVSRTQSRHNTCLTLPGTRGTRGNTRDDQPSPVTVSIGATTRLCVNDTSSTLYQSLPNLTKSESKLLHHTRTSKTPHMPHMGTSRLVTPPKPPRIRSVLINNHTSTMDKQRNKISTSTVMLNRSNTSIGYVSREFDPTEDNQNKSKLLRSARESSCGSDTSSGVFSLGSCPPDTSDNTSTPVPVPVDQNICKVSVNGQFL